MAKHCVKIDELAPSQVNIVEKSGTSTKRSGRRNRCIVPVAIVCGFMIMLNAAISLFLIELNQPLIVTFDMKATLDTFLDQSAQRSLSTQQAQGVSKRFDYALQASLRDYQQSHQALMLVSPAVVTGASDVTAEIQQAIADRMRGGGDE